MTTGGIQRFELAAIQWVMTGDVLGLELAARLELAGIHRRMTGVPTDVRRKWGRRPRRADLTLKSNNPNLEGGE